MTRMPQTDLGVEAFLALRDKFFKSDARSKLYQLREKKNTQDDPLDEYICRVLKARLTADVEVVPATGPLISPDMALYRAKLCNGAKREELRADSTRILGVEVKKLQRTSTGKIARASGMDYNSTPPCGTVRLYGNDGTPLDVKGFYLFVCQEAVKEKANTYQLTALVLCDGSLLNEDFGYYASIIGRRSKEIGLGTYGDGANRKRPMIIFSNPLGAPFLDHNATLIHAHEDLEAIHPALRYLGPIERKVPCESNPGIRTFHCYRDRRDVPARPEVICIRDPFPVPKRTKATAARGRFMTSIQPSR